MMFASTSCLEHHAHLAANTFISSHFDNMLKNVIIKYQKLGKQILWISRGYFEFKTVKNGEQADPDIFRDNIIWFYIE